MSNASGAAGAPSERGATGEQGATVERGATGARGNPGAPGTSANKASEGSVYEFNALGVLQLYGEFVEGGPNCTLAVVSSSALGEKGRSALTASAERLGYGRDACMWITLSDGEGELGASDLRTLVEGVDPCGVVATDADAAGLMAKAYSASLKMDAANRVFCRTVVALHDFEAMIEDDEAKQRAWAALKKLAL